MSSPRPLETANDPQGLTRVAIEPISRVEGHGKVTLLLDEHRKVRQARLHIVEFRGFERFIQGRPYWEVPTLVQRLCGICPVSHLLAASKACDAFVIGRAAPTPTADKLRRLLHHAQVLQSNALHFFHLASPDLLFGFDDAVAHRNIVGVLQDRRELGLQGIRIRKYGQEVIRLLTGKRVHGTGSIPGGFNKPLSREDREAMLADIPQIIDWCAQAMALARDLFLAGQPEHGRFADFPSMFMSLVRPDGAGDLYGGALRISDEHGVHVRDQVDVHDYSQLLGEEVKPWTYMKFPFVRAMGPDKGWYRVGPLARINNASYLDTPRAEAAREAFKAWNHGRPVSASLAQHWARMIDMLHAAETIERLLKDPDIIGNDLMATGTPLREGIGVIEAPRGTLIHHYRIGEDDLVSYANLIVSTTHNNTAMNEAVRQVAATYFDGRELSEGLLNHIEVAVRAYDPCLSCATHAVGKMPLRVELLDASGAPIDLLLKHDDGRVERPELPLERQQLAMSGLMEPSAATRAPCLVLAVGNPGRGDDAFGPVLAQQLEAWLAQQSADVQQRVELLCDLQLMVEHADDLRGRSRVLIVDASAQGHDAPAMQAVSADAALAAVRSHASSPAQLLALYRSLWGEDPPPTHLLSMAGRQWELGAPMSPELNAALPAAWRLLEHWLTHEG
ncbi:MAG: hydrogenase maturation protease [Aquabacterium sp.]